MTAQEKFNEAHKEWEDNWDFSSMVAQYGAEYVSEERPDDMLYEFNEDEINNLFPDPWDAFTAGAYAEVNWSDDWFFLDGYGNINTVRDADKYYQDIIDNEDHFRQWCSDSGYFEDEPELDDFDDDEEEEEDEE